MTIELELPSGPRFEAVGRLVLGGLGSRLGLGADRIADFQQALHATLQQESSRNPLVLTMKPTVEALQVALGPFASGAMPRRGVASGVSALVDEVGTHESGGDVWVDLRVIRRRLPLAG